MSRVRRRRRSRARCRITLDGGRRFGDQGSDRDRARLVDFAAAVEAAAAADMDGVGLAFCRVTGWWGSILTR